ncbi:MAG: RodZ domain-containing protein [Pseudomonadota bacterium]
MSEVGTNLLPEQLKNTSEPELDAAPEPIAVASPAADQSAGGQLAAARQQKSLSVQQVADQLKLSPRQIAALEANQFDALPKAVIVRGFVRSYAKLLRIDAEPIVALLPQDAAPAGAQVSALRPAMSTPFLESRLPLMGRTDANNNKYILGAGLLAILAIAFFAFQKFEHTDYLKDLLPASATPAPATVGSSSAGTDTAAEPVSLPAATESPAAAQAGPAAPDADGKAETKAAEVNAVGGKPESDKKPAAVAAPANLASAAVAGPATNAAIPQAKPAVVTAPASQPAAATTSSNMPAAVAAPSAAIDPANAMKLKFRQDSWVQIKRANGTIVTSHLARAGTEESFDVKEPLQIRLGNAGGVDGLLRGASMDIQASKDSNVVNLNVK